MISTALINFSKNLQIIQPESVPTLILISTLIPASQLASCIHIDVFGEAFALRYFPSADYFGADFFVLASCGDHSHLLIRQLYRFFIGAIFLHSVEIGILIVPRADGQLMVTPIIDMVLVGRSVGWRAVVEKSSGR